MADFDVHIATEGFEIEELKQALKERGFRDDRLTARHITWTPEGGLSSCPIIGLHMSKKGHRTPAEALADLAMLQELLKGRDVVGYAHAEGTARDVTITSEKALDLAKPWPFRKFDGRLRKADKTWDLHIAIPKSRLSPELEQALCYENTGLYHMDIMKTRGGVDMEFRVYTIQGVSHVMDAVRLHKTLEQWFRGINAPHVEMKAEIYLGMFRVGDPRIVPPTVDAVALAEAAA